MDLMLILKLNFKKSIYINKIKLFRTNETPNVDTRDNYWDYTFYNTWDKGKYLLPKPTHLVRLYVDSKSVHKSDGFIKMTIENVKNGVIIDLIKNSEQKITSIGSNDQKD